MAAAVGYAGLVGGGRGGRGALGLSFLAHQSPQFQHEFPSLSGQPSVSNSNQNQTQQSSTTPNANPNAISVAAQQQSLLPQQSHSHSHSGGACCLPVAVNIFASTLVVNPFREALVYVVNYNDYSVPRSPK